MPKPTFSDWKKHDYLIEHGQVFQITNIKDQVTDKGQPQKIVQYHTYFSSQPNDRLTCTIPLNNFKLTNIRKPITLSQAKDLFLHLNDETESGVNDETDIEEILQANDPVQITKVIKYLWQIKQDHEQPFSQTKERLYSLGLSKIEQELALVFDISVTDARKKLLSHLKKSR
jgi:RNA polymerase-interacting CarD/CdnL/TRCF family regulator